MSEPWNVEPISALPLFAIADQQRCKRPAFQLPPDVERIADALADRRGANQAITVQELADAAGLFPDAATGTRDTRIRSMIRTHLDKLPFPIVADTNGYYRPSTPEEARHYVHNLLSRAEGNIARLEAFLESCADEPYRQSLPKLPSIAAIRNHISAIH